MSICVNNLSCKIGKKEILKNISLEINVGEIIAILGPNGSGKSTLINTISGNLKKNSGEIIINKKKIEQINLKING